MKRIVLVALLSFASIPALAEENPPSKEVMIGVSDVFVPGRTSRQGEAFVVVSGMFPNSCYRWARAEVKHLTVTSHEIRSYANVAQTICLMVLIPYSREVKLGQLEPGDHKLRFIAGDGTYFEKSLKVE